MIKFLLCLIFFSYASVFADGEKIQIGIDEQLGKYIPLDVKFKNEFGEDVALKELFTMPTVLTFVYYDCPGICTPLMTELADVVGHVDLKPGENYNIVSISIDSEETPELAERKKRNYLKMINKDFPAASWKFLTGNEEDIKKVTDAAGFYYKREGEEFIHSGALIFVNKDGMISRYLFPDYSRFKETYAILPFDFKMAVIETSEGKTIPTVANFLQMCFSYDPEGKTYVLNLTRIFGAGILLMVIGFVVYISVKPKKAKEQEKKR